MSSIAEKWSASELLKIWLFPLVMACRGCREGVLMVFFTIDWFPRGRGGRDSCLLSYFGNWLLETREIEFEIYGTLVHFFFVFSTVLRTY